MLGKNNTRLTLYLGAEKGKVQLKKKFWKVPDLVGGWVWKSPFSKFKKIKKV